MNVPKSSPVSSGTVSSLWRHPAKSMQGSQMSSVVIEARGMVGDRVWAVRDVERGGIRGAKQIAGLLDMSARFESEPTAQSPGGEIVISLLDGTEVRSSDPGVDDRLSAALDHRVVLEELRPKDDLDHYRRGKPDSDDLVTELRTVFARTQDEPLPDLTDFGHTFEFESPPGTYFDAYPVQILTETSLATLQRLNPESSLDIRRFRPNIVLADNGEHDTFPEQDWIGHKLVVGDVGFEVVTGTPRCVVITRPFDDLPADRQVLRSIVKHADQKLGAYATVTTPGRIFESDTFRVERVDPS